MKHSNAIVRKRTTCQSNNMDEIGVCIIGVHFMFSDIMVVVQQMASATIFVKSPWESFEWILSDLRGFLTVCLSCSALPKFYAADYKAFSVWSLAKLWTSPFPDLEFQEIKLEHQVGCFSHCQLLHFVTVRVWIIRWRSFLFSPWWLWIRPIKQNELF